MIANLARLGGESDFIALYLGKAGIFCLKCDCPWNLILKKIWFCFKAFVFPSGQES